jgi:hypothetical protein
MSNSISLVELAEQQVTLLPARTVLSLINASPADGAGSTNQGGSDGKPGQAGASGDSVQGSGKTMGHGHFDPAGNLGY